MQTASPEVHALSHRVTTAIEQTNRVGVSDRSHRSGYIAALSGCVPVGQHSAFAVMVAHPIEDPNIIVKVCTEDDGFVMYALMCLHGILTGPEYLVVHSAAQVGTNWVFVTERLQEFYPMHGWIPTDAPEVRLRLTKLMEATGVEQAYLHHVGWDLHYGNIMLRGKQHVILDPWATADGCIDAGIPVKLRAEPDVCAAHELHIE